MNSKVLFLLAFVPALAFGEFVSRFVPTGKEVIYDCHARVRTGTFSPASFASQFTLEGKLHLQSDEKSMLMKISDVKFKLYNGKLNEITENESKAMPLPAEVEDMLKPFRVFYDEDGKARFIATEKQDRKFSRDFKKAMASIMQLDMKQIKLDAKTPFAFISEEDTIYGRGPAGYNVMPRGNEIIVQKMLDVSRFTNWVSYLGITDDELYSEMKFRSPMSVAAQREYHIIKDGEEMRVNRIEAHGGIYKHPLRGLSENHYLSVNQSMHLLQVIPIKEKMTMGPEEIKTDLHFNIEKDMDSDTVADLSFGRREKKTEQLVKILNEILEDVVAYLEENQLTMETPDMKKGQAINRLQRLLGHMDLATLEDMFAKMSEKTDDHDKKLFKIFKEVVPLAGTRASTILVRNIVRKNKVDDKMAICMLTKLPFHLRTKSKKLLTEVEDLMNLQNVSEDVRKTAILTFASLVRKVHSRDIKIGGGEMKDHSHEVTTEEIKENLVEKYVLKFMDLLKTSQDFRSQFLYMHALYNIKIGNVVKYLEPYVKGEVPNLNRNLRFLAMCASWQEGVEDPKRVFEIFWPILTDRTLDLEIRAAAYLFIMSTNPDMSILWNIYWFMRTEDCPEMYHLHYTHMKSVSMTTNPMLKEARVKASQVLKEMRKPFRQRWSGIYKMDYIDPKYGFGSALNAMLISSQNSKSMFLEFDSQIYNLPIGRRALWLKIAGLDKTLMDKIPSAKDIHNDVYELEMLLKMLSTLKEQKDLHIEVVLLNHNQVVKSEYFDHTNADKLKDLFNNLITKHLLVSKLEVSYDLMAQMVMPNDLGFPTVLQVKMPAITNNKMLFTENTANDIKLKQGDMRIHHSMQSIFDMSFYNPVADIWQGVMRSQLYDMVIPLKFQFSISKPSTFKLTLNGHKDEKTDMMGMRTYATTFTYVFSDLNNILKQSSSDSPHFAQVSNGEKYRKMTTLVDKEDDNTGLRFQVAAFDTHQHVSRNTFMRTLKEVSQKTFHNGHHMPLGHLILTSRNLWSRMFLSPKVGTFGFIMRAEPSKHKVDHIDITIRNSMDIDRSHRVRVPKKKLNTRMTYSVKTADDKVLKTWDVHARLDMNLGHTQNHMSLQIAKIMPEKENSWKMCMDTIKMWDMDDSHMNRMTGNMTFTMGSDTEKKCDELETAMLVNIKATRSKEQNEMDDKEMTYDQCRRMHMYEPHMSDLQMPHCMHISCLEKYTSLRRMEAEITMEKYSERCKKDLEDIAQLIRSMNLGHMKHEKLNTIMEDKHMKLIFEFPVMGEEMNVELRRKDDSFQLREIPNSIWSTIRMTPLNYHFSRKFLMDHRHGLTKSCLVNDEMILNEASRPIPVTTKWMELLSNREDPTLKIFMKKIDGQKRLALRVDMVDNKKLEVIPKGDKYDITLDGKPIPEDHVDKWFSMEMLKDKHRTLLLHVLQSGLYIAFDGERMRMDMPGIENELTGLCVEK